MSNTTKITKIRVGYEHEDYGTITATADGLIYEGDTTMLKHLVDMVVRPEKPENHPQGLTGFLAWFARQMNNGYYWTRVEDVEHGSSR